MTVNCKVSQKIVFTSCVSDEIHKLVNDIWNQHTRSMQLITNIFNVLDRQYVLKDPTLPSIKEMSTKLFKKYVISEQENLAENLVKSVLAEIKNERYDLDTDLNFLKSILSMITDLKIYEPLFEPKLLEESKSFYAGEAGTLAKSLCFADYLAHIDSRIKQEHDRRFSYLEQGTSNKLIQIVIENFLESKLEILIQQKSSSSFDKLIAAENSGDTLKLLFKLASRFKAGLGIVKAEFQKVVTESGTKIVMRESDFQNMIPELLKLKQKMDEIIENYFESDAAFKDALKQACETFINKKSSKPAELMAKFIDAKMRSKDKNEDIESMEDVFTQVMVLFQCIQGKDVFEQHYKFDLAKRLINNKSVSVDAEKSMLSKLKHECGAQFTAHLEGMFRDMDQSKEITSTWLKKQEENTEDMKVDTKISIEFNILTIANWPSYQVQDITVPIQKELDDFKEFYLKEHHSRKLTWYPSLGQVTLKYRNNEGKIIHEMVAQVFQALVLLEFSENDKWTVDELKQRTKIPDEEITRSIQSLAFGKVKLLNRTNKPDEKVTIVNNDDVFEFNKKFKNRV